MQRRDLKRGLNQYKKRSHEGNLQTVIIQGNYVAKNGSSYQQETENVTIAIMSQKFDQSGRKNELETEKCDRS